MILLRDRLIIKKNKPKAENSQGIVLTETMVQNVMHGVVEEVGLEVKHIKVGDEVMYSPFHYDDLGDERIIVAEEDIWAITSR